MIHDFRFVLFIYNTELSVPTAYAGLYIVDGRIRFSNCCKSVKPKLEISEGVINNNTLSFDVYRVEGADVYGSWLIGIELFDARNNIILDYTQDDLATLSDESISNYYIAKIEPSKHSLLIPLGAKARLHLKNDALSNLPKGTYTLKMTDISGVFWEHKIEEN